MHSNIEKETKNTLISLNTECGKYKICEMVDISIKKKKIKVKKSIFSELIYLNEINKINGTQNSAFIKARDKGLLKKVIKDKTIKSIKLNIIIQPLKFQLNINTLIHFLQIEQ